MLESTITVMGVDIMVIFNALQTSLSGGIGRYSYELSKAIYKSNEISFKIVIREEDRKLFNFVKSEDLIIVKGIKDSKRRNYYEQFILPQKIYRKFPDAIMHYPDTMAPLFAKNKVIITVHDLAFKSLKGVFTWKTALWKNIITGLSIKKADKIIAITNFTKSEIEKHYSDTSENKISVVYNGFNDFSKDKIDESKININILKMNKPYILTVSTISPRKNIDGLIKGFNKIKDEIQHNLVIVGKNGWLYEDVFNLVKELKLQDRVFFTGGVNDNELKFLYKNADLFVYPSFYEGFGLPPLEAMSFGVTCVVSNVSSIPEVVGDAGIYMDPKKINTISSKINEVITNYSLKKLMAEKSKKRIKKFSWNKCSKQCLKIYKSI